MKFAWKWSVPLVLFAALVIFLYIGLYRDPRAVPSPLIGKPAPSFSLRQLDAAQTLSTADMHGKVWLLNVWASWCESCRVEHPLLVELARQNLAPIIGLDYKDKDDLGRAWLAERGNPYAISVVDADGRVGIDWGVYGVPETFVVDKRGVIRYKQIGPVTADALQTTIMPLIRVLQEES
ncbi:MAG: DsbE family thiol:disulfide interchange protein [Casimicrobiaceae bacterium]